MRIRIIIDTEDALDAPQSPFTLSMFHDDDAGDQSRIPQELSDGSLCLIGSSIPEMLRALADDLQRQDEDATLCPSCWGIIPPEGTQMVEEDGELCVCLTDTKGEARA
jgi:hypothetical protein